MTFIYIVYILAALAIVLLPLGTKDGAYNTVSGLIRCGNNRSLCLHEVGHKLDHEAGWISGSKEFGAAIQVYLVYQIAHADDMDETAHWVLNYDGLLIAPSDPFRDTHKELYADLYRWSDGIKENMPEAFRQFYDWERADALMNYYMDGD